MYFVEGFGCWFDKDTIEWKYYHDNSTSDFQSILGIIVYCNFPSNFSKVEISLYFVLEFYNKKNHTKKH
jgi:hypothetical protein